MNNKPERTLRNFLEYLGEMPLTIEENNGKEHFVDLDWRNNDHGIPSYLDYLLDINVNIVNADEYGNLTVLLSN